MVNDWFLARRFLPRLSYFLSVPVFILPGGKIRFRREPVATIRQSSRRKPAGLAAEGKMQPRNCIVETRGLELKSIDR